MLSVFETEHHGGFPTKFGIYGKVGKSSRLHPERLSGTHVRMRQSELSLREDLDTILLLSSACLSAPASLEESLHSLTRIRRRQTISSLDLTEALILSQGVERSRKQSWGRI